MEDVLIDPNASVQSPFLPGTRVQFAWDSTSLGMLKTCARLYYYTMIEGWSPHDESIHLRFGIEYHSALENFDRLKAAGAEFDEAQREMVRGVLTSTAGWEPDRETKAGKYKNRDSIVASVINYTDHFKDDPAETYILDNGKPAVELSFKFQLDWGPKAGTLNEYNAPIGEDIGAVRQPYLLCGHLDRVVNFSDALYAMDRKTTMTTIGSYYYDQYAPHNQMTLYSLASKMILHAPIRGVIIDAAQLLLTPPYNKFGRGFTYRTPDQLDEWQEDLAYWFSIAESYAMNGYWPMNDTACGNYGGCRFRDICSKSPQVREKFLESKFTKQEPKDRWNPLSVRG